MTGWIRTLRCAAMLFVALLAAGATHADSSDARELDRRFARSTLKIATHDARLHTFDVWVADDDARRARGLMFVKELADTTGMLFVYPRSQSVAMWMKNTHIPLDMLFVRADGKVARIAENTTPMSLETIESGEAVLAVIELKGGSAARLKIRPGARVMHEAFGGK